MKKLLLGLLFLLPLPMFGQGTLACFQSNAAGQTVGAYCSVAQQTFWVQAVVSSATTSSAASLTAAYGSNTTKGNTLIVTFCNGNTNNPTSPISDTLSLTWSQDIQQNNGTFECAIYHAPNPTGGADTVTVTPGGTNAAIAMSVYEGQGFVQPVVDSSPAGPQALDQTSYGFPASGTTSPTLQLTPNYGNESVLAVYGLGTAAQTITVKSPYNNDSGQKNPTSPSGLFSFVSTSLYKQGLEATAPSATIGSSEPWIAIAASFKTAAATFNGSLNLQNIGGAPVSPYAQLMQLTPSNITGTLTGTGVRSPGQSYQGVLEYQWVGITGSPSTCQVALDPAIYLGTQAGSAFATISLSSLASGAGFATAVVTPSSGLLSGDSIVPVYSCSVYPTGGYLYINFAPLNPATLTDGTLPMGIMNNFGTTPGAVKALNANVSLFVGTTAVSSSSGVPVSPATSSIFEVAPTSSANTSANPFYNALTDGTNAMGAMANFGTTPTGVKSLNVNASLFSGTTALGTPNTFGTTAPTGNALGTNAALFVGTNPVSGTAPVPISATTAANTKTNPVFTQASDGTNSVTLDPCAVNAGSSANISLTASGQVITGTSSKQTYICSLDLVTATAQNIALVEGTGTTCASSTTGMAGGATAATGWNFAANSGLVKGNGGNWVFKTATAADNVCLLLSGTGQTSGAIRYVQQ